MRQWKTLDAFQSNEQFAKTAGYSSSRSDNDEVDFQILSSLNKNAVDLLITEDKSLRNHAIKAGYGDRTLSIKGCIEYLQRLYSEAPTLPSVEEVKGYSLDGDDPIFESLNEDYLDFKDWFRDKVCNDHRPCHVIYGADRSLEAIAILKEENGGEHGLGGRLLKICTFKVAAYAVGAKRGELLLKSIFQFAHQANIDQIYVEVYPKHVDIIDLFKDFGFYISNRLATNEQLVLVKNRRPPSSDSSIDPFEFHRNYGPPALTISRAFIVPIIPKWHDILFPEIQNQKSLFRPDASGNAIKKAYLSKSPVSTLTPGDTLLFYRSSGDKNVSAVTAIGVVEQVQRLSSVSEIRRSVGLRTVFQDKEIQKLCEDGSPVLVILFRQDRFVVEPWTLLNLIENNLLMAAPRSIKKVKDESALEWLRKELNVQH